MTFLFFRRIDALRIYVPRRVESPFGALSHCSSLIKLCIMYKIYTEHHQLSIMNRNISHPVVIGDKTTILSMESFGMEEVEHNQYRRRQAIQLPYRRSQTAGRSGLESTSGSLEVLIAAPKHLDMD